MFIKLRWKIFSNFTNLFLKAEKNIISYVFNFFNSILNLKWSKPNFIYNHLIFDKFEFFTSKKNLSKAEHLPSLLVKLANNLNLKLSSKENYYYEIKKKDILHLQNYLIKRLDQNMY